MLLNISKINFRIISTVIPSTGQYQTFKDALLFLLDFNKLKKKNKKKESEFKQIIDANEFKTTSSYQVKYKNEGGELKVITSPYRIETKETNNIITSTEGNCVLTCPKDYPYDNDSLGEQQHEYEWYKEFHDNPGHVSRRSLSARK